MTDFDDVWVISDTDTEDVAGWEMGYILELVVNEDLGRMEEV